MVYTAIENLVKYSLDCRLISEEDCVFIRNRILEVLEIDEYTEAACEHPLPLLETILAELCSYAAEKGIIPADTVVYRDLFDTKLMGLLTPRPSEVISRFRSSYAKSPEQATYEYYKFSCDTDYIRRYRIERDVKWKTETDYGSLDITINLSKPEKDPRDIAAAKNAKQSGYPKCLLCRENEGYAGRVNSPARQNHRVIPIKIAGSDWALQYSPYVYYNEHCILFNLEHKPMVINEDAFAKLLDFVRQFPHYFAGSNADLPIVGGSILSHEHFQGGRYEFAMAKAPIEREYVFDGFEDVKAGIVKWPMSVIRLSCKDSAGLVALGGKILSAWRGYSDEKRSIFAFTDGIPHNTITPIARNKDGVFQLDLVLRNNLTTPEHPLGLYHPHAELHHIKKENIGLIEVMGLAVLPARLKDEMRLLADTLVKKGCNALREAPLLEKHADWAAEFSARRNITPDNADEVIREEIGHVFERVLEHAGVYARSEDGAEGFTAFLDSVR